MEGGMTRKVTAFLMTVCLLFAAEAMAASMSGNEWKQLYRGEQNTYVWGVVDAWQNLQQAALLLEQQPSVVTSFTKLVKCINEGMTYGQVVAIVQKYMENNPSKWHESMSWLVWIALSEACK
jgi:hypothetical protein